jgi:hypothetical protein
VEKLRVIRFYLLVVGRVSGVRSVYGEPFCAHDVQRMPTARARRRQRFAMPSIANTAQTPSDRLTVKIMGNPRMTEFDAYRGDAIQIKENIITKITALSSFSSDDPNPLLAEIESLLRDLSSQLDLIRAQQTMWDTAEREAATRFVQELSAESRRLGDEYAHERQRIEKRPDAAAATSNTDALIQGAADEHAVAGALSGSWNRKRTGSPPLADISRRSKSTATRKARRGCRGVRTQRERSQSG